MRAGIYTRLSSDPDGTSTATERQRQDCQELATVRGYEVVKVYEDNDLSAFKRGVKRPGFEDMLLDLANAEIDVVVVWRTDRLARQPRDLERFIDAAEVNHGVLLSVTEPDFSGSSGLLILRMLMAFANHESTVKSERIARKNKECAERGEPRTGGQRTFGYNRDFTPHETEAPLFVEAVRRVLNGESYNVIVSEWNDAGIKTPTGCVWRLGNWRRMLVAPAFAGLRSYHGEIIQGTWQGLITPETREQLVSVIGSRHQAQTKRVSVHLLTGIAVCSCGAPLMGVTRRHGLEYKCDLQKAGCGKTTIRAHLLEPQVLEHFFGYMERLDERTAKSVDVTTELLSLREDEAAMAQLTKDHYVSHHIDRPTFLRTLAELEGRMATTRVTIARSGPLESLRNTDVRAAWSSYSIARQREMLKSAFMGVTVEPAHRNRYADRVTILSCAD